MYLGQGMRGIEGKRVLITGGSSGIGRAAAIAFAEAGASVLINHFEDAAGAVETLRLCHPASGARVEAAEADIATDAAAGFLLERCRAAFGGLDILINNAAIKRVGDPIDYSAADYDRVMAVNARGPFLLAQAAVRQFRAQGQPGVIVNVASVHDTKPLVSDIGYTMSKAAVSLLTRTLAVAVGPEGIRVVGVSPGAIDTPMNKSWSERPRAREAYGLTLPLQRVGQPEEIASILLFVASDGASYMTGQTVYADGGLLL